MLVSLGQQYVTTIGSLLTIKMKDRSDSQHPISPFQVIILSSTSRACYKQSEANQGIWCLSERIPQEAIGSGVRLQWLVDESTRRVRVGVFKPQGLWLTPAPASVHAGREQVISHEVRFLPKRTPRFPAPKNWRGEWVNNGNVLCARVWICLARKSPKTQMQEKKNHAPTEPSPKLAEAPCIIVCTPRN